MPVYLKTGPEIDLMRASCAKLAQVFDALEKMIRPGISTKEIDQEGERLIRSLGGVPNFLHYEGYPASICVSVNEEVVHGIPDRGRILKEGDIVSLDAGMVYKGWHSDAARTYAVGKISEEDEALIEAAEESFFEGLAFARPGCTLYQISAAIGNWAEARGYGVIRDLAGHGIGRSLHEDPMIPNFAQETKGILLVPGMTLAIEPMLAAGTREVEWKDDGWTVVTADGRKASHYENTVLITESDPEILTLPGGRKGKGPGREAAAE